MSYKTDMVDYAAMTDGAILEEIGRSLRRMRLTRNISQNDLARRAGVNRDTVIQLESGRAATMLTIIQLLRALDRLSILDAFRETPEISPIRMLKVAEHERKRASGGSGSDLKPAGARS